MNILKEGSAATCGICQKETTVSFITDRNGIFGYDLACQHRNAYCETCDKLVRDASDSIKTVQPHCDTCDGNWFDDEE